MTWRAAAYGVRLMRSARPKTMEAEVRSLEKLKSRKIGPWPNKMPLEFRPSAGWKTWPGRRPMTATSRPMFFARSGLLRSVAATFVSGPRLTMVRGPRSSARSSAECAGSTEVVRSAFNAVDEPLWTRTSEFPATRPTSSRVVRSTTDSGALPKKVEISTTSTSVECMRMSIAKQSSGSALPPLHAASVSIHTRVGRSTCGPLRTSGKGRPSDSPVRQFRMGRVYVSGSRVAAKSNRDPPTRTNALRCGSMQLRIPGRYSQRRTRAL